MDNKIIIYENTTPEVPKYRMGRFITSVVCIALIIVLVTLVSCVSNGILSGLNNMSESEETTGYEGAALFISMAMMSSLSLFIIPVPFLALIGFITAITSIRHLPNEITKIFSIITCAAHGIIVAFFAVQIGRAHV